MRGRKPTPTWLKVVQGNPGRRPLNDAEPQPVGDLTEPPTWLTESQKEGWKYAIENAPAGLLKRLDQSVLTIWVVAEDLYQDAVQKVAQYGAVIKAPITNVPMQSPFMAVVNKQALIMLKAGAEMGFTPSSRSRVRIDGSSKVQNKFADLKTLPDDV